MRGGFTVLVSAALLAAGAPATLALAQDVPVGTTAGTTGAQSSTTCPKPSLGGLPKRPKLANAAIHFKLTNLPVGSSYLIKAGRGEVSGGAAQGSTVKGKFQLPNQGTKSHKVDITAIVDTENCTNAPWKLRKQIRYKAVQAPTPAPATPATPAAPAKPTPAAPSRPATPAKPAPAATHAPAPPKLPKAKPVKTPKPWQVQPTLGTPLSVRMYMTPIDGASRLEQKVAAPRLSRLEQKTDKAKSDHALIGLGIVGTLFIASTIAGLWTFVRRDEVQFERAMSYQLKHLDEGDFSVMPDEDPGPEGPPLQPSEEAPFADPAAVPTEEPATVPVAAPSHEELVRHRAELEQELQRILTEAGVEAELQGILADARREAERQGVALDTDLMLQTICDELNGSVTLSDGKREGIRRMFAAIIAEETQRASRSESAEQQEATAPAAAS
jgi:hypothetical protein